MKVRKVIDRIRSVLHLSQLAQLRFAQDRSPNVVLYVGGESLKLICWNLAFATSATLPSPNALKNRA